MIYDEFESVEVFTKCFQDRIEKKYVIDFKDSNNYQRYVVLGEMLRGRIAEDWQKTNEALVKDNMRRTYYFSMEFLMGRMITNNLMNAGLRPIVEEAFQKMNLDINEIEHEETDAGLGNGGLGRLAACFLDSSASINLPVFGNCIRYRYGFFEQGIENGYQVEKPDRWLKDVNVWEIRRPEDSVDVPFFGHVNIGYENGCLKITHEDAEYIKAVPYDIPIIGDHNHVVNTLRLWSAEPSDKPSHIDPFENNRRIREISSMLYPDDSTEDGKLLRLKQQYMFVSAGLNSIIKTHKKSNPSLHNLADKVCIQINDTHPALMVGELMRVLVDVEKFSWDEAWNITTHTCAFTNHTILAEASEKWPIYLFQKLLPRVYMIIEEINRRFCEQIKDFCAGDPDKLYKMAIIGNNNVRMSNLAIVGSFSVNGVAKLHTEILKNIEMKEFNEYYPGKYNNKTNGITHRRWCYQSNPELREILNDVTDSKWVSNPDMMENLMKYIDNPEMQERIREMKLQRKIALRDKIYASQGVLLDENSIFDIQVKRLHEYKRQLMNALHVMYLYNRLKSDPEFKKNFHPHSFIFGAKAAPSYRFAKKVIKLINCIANKVNNDPETNQYLKCVFVINYNVSYAEVIMPAADLSEQISTASKEASGTGNMKFMMNGAITIGTLDGANVEISEAVGQDNIILFGLHADEVNNIQAHGGYNPVDFYLGDPRIRQVVDQLTNGFFTDAPMDEFVEIKNTLLQNDRYFVLKDFASYCEAQEKANELYKNREKWTRMSMINIAKSGFFSTDRTIREYNRDIWHLDEYKLQ